MIPSIVHDLNEIITGSERVYYPTITQGTAGQGDTLEKMVFNIGRNNDRKADFRGQIELKTVGMGKRVFRPLTMAGGHEKALVENWGSVSRDGRHCFNLGFRCGKPKIIRKGTPRAIETELHLDTDALRLVFGQRIVGEWDRKTCTERLEEKMSDLCIVRARKKISQDRTMYNYHDYTLYGGFNADAFWTAVGQGAILVEFRVRGAIDKGTCFRMRTDDLSSMYRTVMTKHQYAEQVNYSVD